MSLVNMELQPKAAGSTRRCRLCWSAVWAFVLTLCCAVKCTLAQPQARMYLCRCDAQANRACEHANALLPVKNTSFSGVEQLSAVVKRTRRVLLCLQDGRKLFVASDLVDKFGEKLGDASLQRLGSLSGAPLSPCGFLLSRPSNSTDTCCTALRVATIGSAGQCANLACKLESQSQC